MIYEERLESAKRIAEMSDQVLKLYQGKPTGLVVASHITTYIDILRSIGMDDKVATKYGILLVDEFDNIKSQIDDS